MCPSLQLPSDCAGLKTLLTLTGLCLYKHVFANQHNYQLNGLRYQRQQQRRLYHHCPYHKLIRCWIRTSRWRRLRHGIRSNRDLHLVLHSAYQGCASIHQMLCAHATLSQSESLALLHPRCPTRQCKQHRPCRLGYTCGDMESGRMRHSSVLRAPDPYLRYIAMRR